MDQWNYGRISQQQGAYPSGSYGAQEGTSASGVSQYEGSRARGVYASGPYGAPSASGAAQYGHSQASYSQPYGQQILGKLNDYQGPAGVGADTSMNVSGLYNVDSNYPNTGYGVASVSTAALTQKNDTLKRYSESQLDQQTIRQQHFSQSALRHRAGSSALDTAVRSQTEYVSGSAGRNPTLPSALGGSYGGRELPTSSYIARPETEASLLGSQSNIMSRGGIGVLQFPSQAAEPLGSLGGGRGILGHMYPPSGYGSLEVQSGMPDFSGIVSSHYEDIIDDRMAMRFEYERRDNGRIKEREQSREYDRYRDRDREISRERERELQREKERALERERRERERARERELRDRERDIRRWERSPPRPVAPPPRRDEKMVRKASPTLPKFSSPTMHTRQAYVCKVEPFSLLEVERDLLSLIRRYPKLFVAADFSKAVACWKEVISGISLNHPISFEIDAVDAGEENKTKEGAAKSSEEIDATMRSITWTVKVMLMSGVNADNLRELVSDSSDRPLHMHNVLKFVVLRKERSALMALGGTWDKLLDGGDPATDDNALIQTAIRCTKNSTQLDLQGVQSWTRFMEIHYDRMGENNMAYKEIAVFLIPDLSGVIPSFEDWKLEWKERREDSKHRCETSQKYDKDSKVEVSHKGTGNGTNIGTVKDNQESEVTDVKNDSENIEQEAKQWDVENKEKDKKVVEDEEEKQKERRNDEKSLKQEGKMELMEDDKDCDLKKANKTKADRKDKTKIDEEREDKDAKSKTSDKKSRSRLEQGVPATPGFFITMKRGKCDRIRAMTISLDGLLDYDERDKEEFTFELSLFGEFFQEMLQYKFGCQILEAFETLHPHVQAKLKEERKRTRENNKHSTESTKKKSKFSEKMATDPDTNAPDKDGENAKESINEDMQNLNKPEENDGQKHVKDIDAAMQAASSINLDELEEESQDILRVVSIGVANEIVQSENEVARREEEHIVNKELFQAFRYFDKNMVGYLKAEDVRRLFHTLGRYLTRRWVKDITSSAISECRSKDDCIYYQRLL